MLFRSGKSKISRPEKIDNFNAKRSPNDDCHMSVNWNEVPNAEGYIIRYGITPDKLYNQYEIRDNNKVNITSLNSGIDYFIRIDTFNGAGVTKGNKIVECKSLK